MKRQLSFAEQLRHERERHGWSQENVASKIGCSTKTVTRWEAGKSQPRTYHRQKISKLFGKDLEEFSLVPEPVDDTMTALASQIVSQPALLPAVPGSENIQLAPDQTVETATRAFPMTPYSPAATYQRIQGFPPPTHPRVIQQREHAVKAIYTQLMQSDITALVLTGIGGVGKSTLAALVYRYVLERYPAELCTAEPIWLTISERVTTADVIGTLFEILGKPLPHLETMPLYNQVMILFDVLNTAANARLIILDQFENVLDWQTGYALVERPGMGEMLDAMNSQPCLCKLLLTSRIWPKGTREYPSMYMQEYPVAGLNRTEGSELLRKQGIGTQQASNVLLRKAVTRCAGHALALTLLASLLRQNRSLSLALLFRNALYTKLWQGNIAQQLLDFIYMKQINELQRKLLFAFSIYREAVSLEAALALSDLHTQDEAQVPLSFHTLLMQRLLQASGRGLYHLHAIVADYVRGRYIAMDGAENGLLAAHDRAAQYYLQQAVMYCPPLEQRRCVSDVQPLIEATWHLCQAERWQAACDLISQEELYQTLRRLGENIILLELYRLLQPSEKWHPEERMWEAEIYDHLGRMYAVVGEKELALENYERALQVYEVLEICQEKGRTLHHLGLLYESLGQDTRAKTFHEQALFVNRKTGDSKGEADSLNGLGWIYHRLGQQAEALHFCQQSLIIHQERGNRIGESDTLNALGLIYHGSGAMKQARQCYTQSLSTRREIGNREKVGRTLNNLGLVYADLEQIEKAWEYFKESYLIRKEIGDRKGEGGVLYNLSKMYFKRHHYDIALAGFLLARKIFKDVWSSEYEATQRWIETVQKTLGEAAFTDLLGVVELEALKIVEKAFNANTEFDTEEKT